MRRADGRARAQSGGVFLDGCPLPAVQHEFLHKQVSIVSQEPILFAESILYNIAFGARAPPTPSFQGAWSCLRCSHAELVQLEVSQQAAVCAAAASGRHAGGGVGRRTSGGGPRQAPAAEPGERRAGARRAQAQRSASRCSVDELCGGRAGAALRKPLLCGQAVRRPRRRSAPQAAALWTSCAAAAPTPPFAALSGARAGP